MPFLCSSQTCRLQVDFVSNEIYWGEVFARAARTTGAVPFYSERDFLEIDTDSPNDRTHAWHLLDLNNYTGPSWTSYKHSCHYRKDGMLINSKMAVANCLERLSPW